MVCKAVLAHSAQHIPSATLQGEACPYKPSACQQEELKQKEIAEREAKKKQREAEREAKEKERKKRLKEQEKRRIKEEAAKKEEEERMRKVWAHLGSGAVHVES